MFFLRLPSGQVVPSLLRAWPMASCRAELDFERIADEVESSGADGVVVVAEAWRAKPSNIPDGGSAGDATESEDVLVIAGLDREGNECALQTPMHRRGLAEEAHYYGETEATDMRSPFLDRVREVWGLPPALG